ncbi:hypothetical protein [Luteibacter yeojuensis]|uniref:Uncharacterized protein n=1 Tax=Luteibacter yeojuensis TaxID=345309 RepID=A0A0F3KMV9_9GAMM|nr:hypothetical protein [Luteibacter yeojuensis]KJV32516.1 hypothetical protein VI08_12325 [Luteibacter yeojuensis]
MATDTAPRTDTFRTLQQLADTALLARSPLDEDDCRALEGVGLVASDDGYWRITAKGRQALSMRPFGMHGR